MEKALNNFTAKQLGTKVENQPSAFPENSDDGSTQMSFFSQRNGSDSCVKWFLLHSYC